MKTYNSYQEARIANPQSNICVSTDGEFAAKGCVLKLRMAEINKWISCSPKDYCMTLAEFLSNGYRLIEGDMYYSTSVNAVHVVGISMPCSAANESSRSDKDRYILRAKALEQAEFDTTPQQVESLSGGEWKNGDQCIFDNQPGLLLCNIAEERIGMPCSVVTKFKNNRGFNMLLVEFADGYCCALREECLSKPETPQQRQEREELEAAYELYCEWYNDGQTKIKPDSFEKFSQRSVLGTLSGDAEDFIRLVRKTKYRKEAK